MTHAHVNQSVQYALPKNVWELLQLRLQETNTSDQSEREKSRGLLKNLPPEIKKRYAAQIERFGDDYGFVLELKSYARHISECEGCTGTCQKSGQKYFQPVIHINDYNGYVYNGLKYCPYADEHFMPERCSRAGVPEQFIGKKFSDFSTNEDTIETFKIAQWYCKERPLKGLFLYGGVGTGKTFMASLIAQEFLRADQDVRFFDMPGLLSKIRATFGDKLFPTNDFIDEICDCDLLILDDIGAEKVTDWSVEQLYMIVNRRYNMRLPLIATSNLHEEALQKRLGDDVTAERIISRLKGMTISAFFGIKDWRV